ncbi:MAG: penicillin-binding protein activator [Pseudomonadales bacterium]|nr:penicillin-binding protein activator [Pseudomonadales bacterium]MDG0999880.1 penicillin-binding protein activator [Pseudomonadales bacterium]MDG1305367.1 penicillin-binding protein activator [Pseudomonadales bacterium]MDG1909848.1 penicillin-binding protein activator [Pseudomonadales bacterium]|tara:strand:- start:229 stop:2118 length:1890 start_codon:yes stop_codon:yes gene_type:complete
MFHHYPSYACLGVKNYFHCVVRAATVLSLALLLSSCATESGTQNTRLVERTDPDDILETKSLRDIETLLIQADQSEPGKAKVLRLYAAELALLKTEDAARARKIADLIVNDFSPELLKRYFLVQIKIALLEGEPRKALEVLAEPRLMAAPLRKSHQLEVGKLRAQAYYQSRSYLASARERIFYNNFLTLDQRAENHELIFSTLMEIPTKSLATQAEKAITSDLRGWLALATMTKQFQNNPLQQYEALSNWQRVWGQHPASIQLPLSLSILTQVISSQPKSIALLLPTNGTLGPFGRAIRDGIIASHYHQNGKAEIRVYDTSNQNVLELIDRAAANGAELIIGPLDRNNVNTLALQSSLPVPVLALNRSIEQAKSSDIYQFGLAPEDEMVQVADQAFSDGNKKVLALFPDSAWGNRNFETFKSHWLDLGGTIVDSSSYSSQKSYADLVKSLLNVDESELRSTSLRRIVGKRFEFTPRRRQDIDFIFLLGDPAQARGINPTLAFFYAENIPVYSTSHVHELDDSKIDSIDLNGIRFCDIPWKIAEGDPVQLSIKKAWPLSQAQMAPFFALGVDAYRVYPRLEQLKKIRTNKIFGSTGVLQLDKNNIITRKLMWAQYRDGEVMTVPMNLDAT